MERIIPMKNIPENRIRANSELGYSIEYFEMNDLSRLWSCIIADNKLLTGNQFDKERYYKESVYRFLDKLGEDGAIKFLKWDVIKYGSVVGLNLSENRKILLYHKDTWNNRMTGFDKSNVLDLNKL